MTNINNEEIQLGEWDEKGLISIIIQGPLQHDNIIEVANNCQHWRVLFPYAEIILSISSTNCAEEIDSSNITLDFAFIDDRLLQEACKIINASCNIVGLSDPALPLPPIKSDINKVNNINLQISAAKWGLSKATGQYVLRVRNDLIFIDRTFLKQYKDSKYRERKSSSIFCERVLISWLYTVNPFTNERLPFHYSDWFHFGLIDDVKKIWSAPYFTLKDAVYYHAIPHNSVTNSSEKLFNTRIAVEQHLIYHCFKPFFKNLMLDYHNDQRSIELSMSILADNFVLCDLKKASCYFYKYSKEFDNPLKILDCITHDDWLKMTQHEEGNYRSIFSGKIANFNRSGIEVDIERINFRGIIDKLKHYTYIKRENNRIYKALYFDTSTLMTKCGHPSNGKIISRGSSGTVIYGPYTSLNAGRYTAEVDVTEIKGFGRVRLKAWTDFGQKILSEKALRIKTKKTPRLLITFDVPSSGVDNLEIICDIEGLDGISVSGLTIMKHSNDIGETIWRLL